MIESIRKARDAGLMGKNLPEAEPDHTSEYIRLLLENGIKTMTMIEDLQRRVAHLEEEVRR